VVQIQVKCKSCILLDFYWHEDNVLLKTESSDNPILEVICLAPKCGRLLLEDGSARNTTEGVNRSNKIKFRRETYKKVQEIIVKDIRSPCATIKSIKNELYTINITKIAL